MAARERECLGCGMVVAVADFDLEAVPPLLRCVKCDANLYLQSDGSCLTVDIAHQQETVSRALRKLDALLLEAWQGYYRSIRIIVGGGRIRAEVLGQLHHYQQQRRLLAYREESPNRGAIVVTLR
jgi:hypothetical protein